MKKSLLLILIVIMTIPFGIINVNAASSPQFEYSLTFTDSGGNIVTSAKRGETLTGTLTLTRTDIADNSTYRLRGVDMQFEYPKGDGLEVSVPVSDYPQIVGVQKNGNVGNSSFRTAYLDISWIDTETEGVFKIEGIQVNKTFKLGTFSVKIGSEALSSYTFIPKINEVFISDENAIGDDNKYEAKGNDVTLTISDSTSGGSWEGTSGGSGGGNNSGGSTIVTGGGIQNPVTTPPVTTDPVKKVSLASEITDAYISGYDDDKNGTPELVKPTGNISRAEIATIFYRLLSDETLTAYKTSSSAFSDVKSNDWFNEAVSTLANCNIISGSDTNGDGVMEFRPNDKITRGELTVIISRFADGAGTETVDFSDIRGHWAEEYINTAAAHGWIKGSDINNDGKSEFRPNDTITRAETAAIVNRMLKRTSLSNGSTDANQVTFDDNSDKSAWYYNDIQLAANKYSYN